MTSEHPIPKMQAIVAMSSNRAIGKKGKLPWHLPEEMAWVKKMTTGHILLMGRKTYESIGKPLPNRICIVLTSQALLLPKGHYTIQSLEELCTLPLPKDKILWSFGGERVYEATLPYCTDLYLTCVHQHIEGADAFFPPFEASMTLKEHVLENDQFTIKHYVKSS